MYDIKYFKAHNEAEVLAFMKAHCFVTVCSVGEDGFPVATQIPIVIEERNNTLYFLAHVMRKQLHTIAFENSNKVLIIFSGSHAYVSATNYENPATASTYNYSAVHCKGIIQFVDDDGLVEILTKLTHKFEGNSNSPSLVEKMDKAYIAQHIKAIIGFEIKITDVQHVFKLSQNKTAETREKIVAQLQNSNSLQDVQMAAAIQSFQQPNNQ